MRGADTADQLGNYCDTQLTSLDQCSSGHSMRRSPMPMYFIIQDMPHMTHREFRLHADIVKTRIILGKTEIKSHHTQSDDQKSTRSTVKENTPVPVGGCCAGTVGFSLSTLRGSEGYRCVGCKGGRKSKLLPKSH